MARAQTGKDSDVRCCRFAQRRNGYHLAALRGIAAALFLILSSFIRHTYVTWQDDPCTTATITVHGIDTPSKLTLTCGEKRVEVMGIPLPLPDRRRIYHFPLKGLKPDTRYTFSVAGCEHTFKTLPQSPPFTLIEGGDWENTQEAERLAAYAATLQPDGILLGGDYPSNVCSLRDYAKWDRWLDTYARHLQMTPFVMAIGNHEVVGGYRQPKEQAPFFFHYFRTAENPKSYYALPLGEGCVLYVLDSGHTASHLEQAKWLSSQWDERFSLALYHVPLFPSVRFAKNGLLCHLAQKGVEFLQKRGRLFSEQSEAGLHAWFPLFYTHLDLAFEHHDQALKRTHKIGRTRYLGDGGWGCRHQVPPLQGYLHTHFAKTVGKQHFFWLLEVEANRVSIRALTAMGKELDALMIKR